MTPGAAVQIRPEWRYCYRAHGSAMVGVIQAISPTGRVARIWLDRLADTFVMVSHLEPAGVEGEVEAGVLSAA